LRSLHRLHSQLTSRALQASGTGDSFSLYQKAALFCGQIVADLPQVLGLVPKFEGRKMLAAGVYETASQTQATEQEQAETQKGPAIAFASHPCVSLS
jgi:hypothetical protein